MGVLEMWHVAVGVVSAASWLLLPIMVVKFLALGTKWAQCSGRCHLRFEEWRVRFYGADPL